MTTKYWMCMQGLG